MVTCSKMSLVVHKYNLVPATSAKVTGNCVIFTASNLSQQTIIASSGASFLRVSGRRTAMDCMLNSLFSSPGMRRVFTTKLLHWASSELTRSFW